jgi:drug/metabolite transporter (DMT)-like permease
MQDRTPRVPAAAFGNPYLLLAVAGLCWSGNHIVGRAVAGHVPPFALSTMRWLLPALLLLPLVKPHLKRDWPLIKAHWRILLFLSLTGGALFSALQYLGLQYTTALNVSVFNSLVPVLIVAAGALIFGDRLALPQLLGIVTSLAGVLVIVTRLDFGALAALSFNAGDLIILFNMAAWAVYSSYLRLKPAIHWTSFLFVLAVASCLMTAPLFAWEHYSGFALQPTLLTAGAILYVAIFPSVIAMAAWNRGVELIGSNRAGPFLHFVPLYSAALAYGLLGERLHAYHLLGFALILCGVYFAARKR